MKTLEEYSKEFTDHLNSLEYSSKTVQGYVIAVRQLLCDIIDNNNRDKVYKLKYNPKDLTLEYLKDFTRRVKEHYNPYSHKTKLAGIKYYLKFIKAVYGANIWDEYEKEKVIYGSKKDILKGRPVQEKYKEPLTKGEIESFFTASKYNPRDHALFNVFYYSTQRVHSIVNLNVEDIDFEPKTNANGETYYNITFRYVKGLNKPPIKIPVPTDCIKAINDYLEFREEPVEGYIKDNYGRKLLNKDALFLNGLGERFKVVSIYHMLKRYAVKLDIRKPVYPHLWRHTSITRMYENGMTEGEIKRISGHAKQSNALRTYINPSTENVISKSQDALRLHKSKKVKSVPVKAEPEPQPTPQKPQPKPEPKPESKSQKVEEKPTDSYIAKPKDNKIHQLELKLIEQLANGEISNKVYNDAVQRLHNIAKSNTRSNGLIGYE